MENGDCGKLRLWKRESGDCGKWKMEVVENGNCGVKAPLGLVPVSYR